MAAKKQPLEPMLNKYVRFRVVRERSNEGVGLEWRMYQGTSYNKHVGEHLAWHRTKKQALDHAKAMQEALEGLGRRKHTGKVGAALAQDAYDRTRGLRGLTHNGKVGQAVVEALRGLDAMGAKAKKNKK